MSPLKDGSEKHGNKTKGICLSYRGHPQKQALNVDESSPSHPQKGRVSVDEILQQARVIHKKRVPADTSYREAMTKETPGGME